MTVKGFLHVHSTFSYDGKVTLEELRDLLVAQGISFCCLSEHTDHLTVEEAQLFAQQCKALSTGTFIFIPGFEVPYKNAHILLFGTEVFLGQHADVTMLKQWSMASSLTILAHPVRNTFIVDDVMKEVLDGVEIWNQQYEGKRVPRFRSARLLEHLQKDNQKLLAIGGIDFHRIEHLGAPICSVEVSVLTRSTVMEALQQGSYTFGTSSVQVSSLGIWTGKESVAHISISLFSISVIVVGKKVNALLAYFGFRFPKTLVRFIRQRI